MNTKLIGSVAALLAFGTYSTLVVIEKGYFGFLDLAMAEPWGMQVLLDVAISCSLLLGLWLVPDARRRGIAVWPYVLATFALGSMGPLAYLVHRAIKGAGEDARIGERVSDALRKA